VGLAQREIEAAGITTITLSTIPEVTASVSPPRVAGIEYPLGLPLGRPGDAAGQRAVLAAVLRALEEIRQPGQVRHLPFTWEGKLPRTHPPEPPPLVKLMRRKPWLLAKLHSGDIPA